MGWHGASQLLSFYFLVLFIVVCRKKTVVNVALFLFGKSISPILTGIFKLNKQFGL
jgi:hypothetical protein